MKIFSHFIYSTQKCCKFSTFNTIFIDNAAINCITVYHKKGSCPSTLTGNIMLIHE
jgi:hypothetical protein